MFELFFLATVTVITRTSSTEILQKELNFGWLTATTTESRAEDFSFTFRQKADDVVSVFLAFAHSR